MRPDILILPMRDCALLIGPAPSLKAVAGESGDHVGHHRWRLRSLLAHQVDPWRLRRAALAWGIDHPHRRHWSDHQLQDHVAHWVETGRLATRFVPLFRDDGRRAPETGRLSLHQIGGGPPPAAPPPPPPSSTAPPPPPVQSKSSTAPPKDYENETDQATTFEKAAEDGTPFCAICEAMKAARAAAAAGS